MNFTDFFNTGLTFLVTGFAAAILIFFLMKKKVPGNFWGALVVALIGSILGDTLYKLFPEILSSLSSINAVNVYAGFAVAFILLLIFSKLSASSKN